MKRILIIESSPRRAESASRQLTEALRERLRSLYPNASFVERDLATDPLPHLDYQTVKGISTKNKGRVPKGCTPSLRRTLGGTVVL
jgi:FMN-dependent NADH-azoreductase